MRNSATVVTWRQRALVAAGAAAALALAWSAPSAHGAQILLVHGHGDAVRGTDCNAGTWKNALRYYQDAGGRERSSMTTVGYYKGDKAGCDAMIGDGDASNDRPIQAIAKDLATYIDDTYTSKGRPVNIVAHSMGGLVTRVALLGSAQGWHGFPSRKLNVNNVVTLSTPHQGVAHRAADDDEQWRQMDPDSGFMKRLHKTGSGLGDDWSTGTDWSLVGSQEDAVVSDESAIDKGNAADQKYDYLDDSGDSGEVNHSGVRTRFGKNRYSLRYWHASGDHPPHTTKRGWSPLKAAFQAATRTGDGLPK